MRRFLLIITSILCVLISGCAKSDPYADYQSSNVQAKTFSADFENYHLFSYDKMELITDYETYASYQFGVNYTEEYFEDNNLLIFVVSSCSSDGMQFQELLENDGKLYPCFLRNRIGRNEPVTDDFGVYSACVELPKDSEYKAGEIIFRYREKNFFNWL